MMGQLSLRDPVAADEAAWRDLWAQYLVFYRVTLTEDITAFTWSRLLDPGASLKMRLACLDGQVVGFAIHVAHASTWIMGEDCYLEDLFVSPAARGKGAGRALIEDLCDLARAKGWQRVYWHTDRGNARARALYDSFVLEDGHVRYRVTL